MVPLLANNTTSSNIKDSFQSSSVRSSKVMPLSSYINCSQNLDNASNYPSKSNSSQNQIESSMYPTIQSDDERFRLLSAASNSTYIVNPCSMAEVSSGPYHGGDGYLTSTNNPVYKEFQRGNPSHPFDSSSINKSSVHNNMKWKDSLSISHDNMKHHVGFPMRSGNTYDQMSKFPENFQPKSMSHLNSLPNSGQPFVSLNQSSMNYGSDLFHQDTGPSFINRSDESNSTFQWWSKPQNTLNTISSPSYLSTHTANMQNNEFPKPPTNNLVSHQTHLPPSQVFTQSAVDNSARFSSLPMPSRSQFEVGWN